ncbi:ATP-dependent helicase HrpB [Sulfurospirillum arcachonense]|uniref:ATP-dependent helicase HrpB n=1 Tax=Sulfurospirillum arcachonense TaxID=57666 RepID=UPI0004694875|nr:ATP-dependent helicase HrpB [Sulfurospirillum arcachonense]
MQKLPINEVIPEIKEKLRVNTKLILQAPPGAGKSTVVPISLLDEPWLDNKIIIVLEPRRVAARQVAIQMAKSLGEKVGQRVGYQIKMDKCTSVHTKILVLTEAILVKKLQNNQSLENAALVIFDEFHERSIHTDLSLALSLQVQELLRDDLKILIMSATLNSEALINLLGNVPVVTSQGKIYDVQMNYLESHISQPTVKTLNTVLLQTILKALKEESGDILVFLAGIREIKALQKVLSQKIEDKKMQILPLYSTLSKQDQDRAIEKSDKRKIILSTNIAQTSLTIEGIKIVIDSGLEKLSRYNYATGMNHLELSFISQDSATQRAGRAGRLSSGKCYRLWHKNKILQESTKPEILRTDLSSVVLDLALWGVDEFDELCWLDIPDKKVIAKSKEVLQELMMLDKLYQITLFGKDALSLGMHPRYSYMILKANELGYAYEACLLGALLNAKDIFKNTFRDSDIRTRFIHLYEKDFQSEYINKFVSKEVLKEADSFYKKLKSIKKVVISSKSFEVEMIGILLLFAYPDRLAKKRSQGDAKYKLSNGKGATLHVEDSLFSEEYLVVPNLNAHEQDSYINQACSITLYMVEKYFDSYIKTQESIKYNKQTKKLDIRENKCFLQLQLSSISSTKTDKRDFKDLLIKLLKEEGLELLTWSKEAKSLRNRVNFLNAHTKTDLIDFSDESLMETLDVWIAPYLTNIKTIKELETLNMYNILLSQISWENQKLLDKLVPKSIKVPSGSFISIDYSNIKTPIFAVKIQEVFGLRLAPKILNNTIALQVHLLSPARLPIQITYDLESFWKNSYDEVRKELRGKYKKHYWPENPYEAIATNKTKKNM